MTDILKLKKANCKNCYKCIRHCPVKSIRFSAGQANIVSDECILCGQCFVVCPQNAKEIVDDTEKVKVMLMDGEPVIVSLAPSFVANYCGTDIEEMTKALKKLGFASAEETAIGATIVKREYERMVKDAEHEVIISSCCHSVNLLIRKYFPSALPYLANIVTPMQAHCADIKRRIPNAKTVFIGPCISKKDEARQSDGVVDAVLTFEELSNWLKAENITLAKGTSKKLNESRARLFPTTGGILKTMDCTSEDYTYMVVDGVENCIAALKDIEAGELSHCFIEMSSCAGSCVGGPVMEKQHRAPVRSFQKVSAYAGLLDFDVKPVPQELTKKAYTYLGTNRKMPSGGEIEEILRKMGKTKPEHELNCGSCGYDSCREKAVAVFQGKADLSMCLPFLKEKAESFSDNIINNTPNAIIVLNDELEVQQINRAARMIMNIRSATDVLGEQVIRILDPKVFMDVRDSGHSVRDRRTYLAEYKRYVEQTVIYDKDYRILMCIMRDVTDEENQQTKREAMCRQTVEVADKVVEKQMRVVQEIASLLGETAAETKIALTKLKGSISDE
ncbi:MAG: [Fe-Fe] hydrogenase large subunit C-terminal domain-containing protein [Hydrogenoanaerobacterium sp.]